MTQFISIPVIESNIYMFGGHQHTVQGGWSFFEQKHQAFELMCVISGHQTTEFKNANSITYGPGDVVIISPGTVHLNRNASATDEMTYICFHFDFDSLRLKSRLIGYLANRVLTSDTLTAQKSEQVAKKIVSLSVSETLSAEAIKLEIQIAVLQFMAYLEESLDNDNGHIESHFTDQEAKTSQEIATIIQKMVEQIGDRTFTFHDVCNEIGISKGYGYRTFKKVYGVTPLHYIEDQKYQKAKMLLGYYNYSIEDVADKLGAADLSVFSKQFKKWAGITPSQYRKQITKKRTVKSSKETGYFE
ncbi:helix-turn-helix domain-containing protein [Lentilactobacillus sp. SPB1-3]|uniref:Helix-turn-helix domain-containing protein n=1 Tax=Lentilactobacillus terminaliae TaxID=3003483 RepID=A0ACD5DET7_9LACO|nr:AraC family transcriptional regulator [Lentilactobacillus sp. SPB1-3]MCZ0976441.1 AraC family transcriptional regulator [Lentilactobacillus sp. SPB1-3]